MIRIPWLDHRSASCTMTLEPLCLQIVPLAQGACFLNHSCISEPAEEPRYASQCAWVVAHLPVHVGTLSKSSELARGVQSPDKDEHPSPDIRH